MRRESMSAAVAEYADLVEQRRSASAGLCRSGVTHPSARWKRMTEAVANCRLDEWECTPALDAARFAVVRRRMALDHFKWDPQVADGGSLAPFAVVLPAGVWRTLAALAERLSAEPL